MAKPTDKKTDPYEELDALVAGSKELKNPRFQDSPQLAAALVGSAAALARGAKGEGVKRVQQAMIDMGFALPSGADGIYGKQTAKAVANFQVNARRAFPDVSPTGEVNAATLRALDDLAPAPGKKGQAKNVPVPFFEGKRVRVVVLKDEHRTFLYDAKGNLQRIFLNAVGAKATQTAEGLKVITAKLDEPAAIATGERLWGAPVFGVRILDLSWTDGKKSGEELHGTVTPAELGEDVSHGCVRHANDDIIALFDAVTVGVRVAIASGLADPRLHS